MPYWVQLLLSLAAFALLLALVAAVWALRRTAQRAEAVLTILEQELRPLTGQAHALTEDLRMLTREAGRELERVGAVTDRVDDIATGLSRFVTRSEEHTSELQSPCNLVCRLLLEKKKKNKEQ